MHAIGKLFRLLEFGQFALHPYHIRIRSVRNSTINSTPAPALVAVEPFSSPRGVPVPVNFYPGKSFGNGSSLGITLPFDGGEIFFDQALLVYVDTSVDHFEHCLVEELEPGLSEPLIFYCLEFVAVFAGLLCGDHEIVERLEGRVGDA